MRKYLTTLVIGALLAVSGFTAAAIASQSGSLGLLQTGTTVTLPTVTLTTTTNTTTTTTTTQPRKVTMCHHTRGKKGTKHVTIRVSQSAVRAHHHHGDTIGACSTTRNKKLHAKKAHAQKFHKKARAANKGKAKGRK